jgi:hypothetical protein
MTGPAGDDRSLIDEVFGTGLPQASSDERDHDYWDDRERWLRENVPPHHN